MTRNRRKKPDLEREEPMRVSLMTVVLVMTMVTAMVCGCATMTGTTSGPTPEEGVRAALEDTGAAFAGQDIERMMAGISDDYSNSQGFNKSMVRSFFEGAIAQGALGARINLEKCEIVVNGDYATAEPIIVTTSMGNESQVYKYKKEADGVWRVISNELILAPAIDIWTSAMGGDIEAIRQHVSAGTDVNARNNDGNTALHAAAFFGRTKAVELLLGEGADANARGGTGQTALDTVAPPWSPELEGIYRYIEGLLQTEFDLERIKAARPEIAALLRKQAGKTENVKDDIWSAAAGGDISAIKRHLSIGTDLNAAEPSGNTPLHMSVLFGQMETARLLVENGADINAMSNDGSPLHLAAFLGHTELVKLLLEKGAYTSIPNQNWQTPFEIVTQPWSPELEGIYQYIGGLLQIEFDLARIKAARPIIADLLVQHDR